MSYPIDVIESVAETVLELHRAVRAEHAGEDIGEGMRELYAVADRMGLTPTGPPSATYHGDSAGAHTIRVVLALPVAIEHASEAIERMTLREAESATYARTIHRGDYRRIGAAYRALEDWLRTSGLRSAGPLTETYLVGPDAAIRPRDLTTEIRVPVAPRSRPSVRFDAPVPVVVAEVREALRANGFRVLSEVDIDATIGAPDAPRPHVLLTACLPALARRIRDSDPTRDRLLFLEFVIRCTDGATMVDTPDCAELPGESSELEASLRELRAELAAVTRCLERRARAEFA
ncbi:GyrI-like domain-containing protein [Nocardia arizonensis]|uniref:GyrI-like domain-containing protein n=1 Tax=Nocardia arizonensis TaxID=1141647 RepID=UPI0006D15FD8|nr:GyrI-like domain-containing protein [Nocardia arizonensis]